MSELLKKMIRGKYYYTNKKGKSFVYLKSMDPIFRVDEDDVKELEGHGYRNLLADKENQYKVTFTFKGQKNFLLVLAENEEDAIDEAKSMISVEIPKKHLEETEFEAVHYDKDKAEPPFLFQGKVTILLSDGDTKTKFITEAKEVDNIMGSIKESIPGGEFHKDDILVFDGSAYDKSSICMMFDEKYGFHMI